MDALNWSNVITDINRHQISTSELFLTDHVTLKTGVMANEKSALSSHE